MSNEKFTDETIEDLKSKFPNHAVAVVIADDKGKELFSAYPHNEKAAEMLAISLIEASSEVLREVTGWKRRGE